MKPATPKYPARLFFALWPDDRARKALAAISTAAERTCGGRAMQARNLHLTLAFLGDTEAAQMHSAIAAAGRVEFAPFALQFDQCGFWKQGRSRGILWAGGESPPQLDALAAALRGRLAEASVTFDAKAFVPHVTLLRDASPPPEAVAFAPIPWPAKEFVLVKSERDAAGPLYRIVYGPFGPEAR